MKRWSLSSKHPTDVHVMLEKLLGRSAGQVEYLNVCCLRNNESLILIADNFRIVVDTSRAVSFGTSGSSASFTIRCSFSNLRQKSMSDGQFIPRALIPAGPISRQGFQRVIAREGFY